MAPDSPQPMAGPFDTDRRSYAWFVVAMLWLVCFLNYADRQAIFSVFSAIKSEFRLSDLQLGVLASCFMWAYAAFGPVAGWVSDRLSRSRVVIAALAFWSLCTLGTAVAHSYGELLVWRSLGGLGEAFYFPAAMSLLASYHAQATRSRAMAVHQSSVYVGTIVGGWLSAVVAERFGWRLSFDALGVLGLLLAAALTVLLRDPAKPQVEALEVLRVPQASLAQNLLELARSRAVLVMVAVFMGANFVAVIFLVWMPTFLQRKFHLQLGAAGFDSTAYIQAASIVGVLAGGLLADMARRRTPGGRQLVQAVGLLGGVGFLFVTGHTLTVATLFVSMAGFGLFKGLYDANIWASLYDFVPAERRGLATGVMNSLGWLGAGFAPIAFAAASQHYSVSVCVSATAAIYLVLAVPLILLVVRRAHTAVDVARHSAA